MSSRPIESDVSTSASSADWRGSHQDANIAGSLFRMDGGILRQDAVIRPSWKETGEFIGEERWSYGELQSLARNCCAWLHVRGVRPGQKVLLLVRPGMDLILLVFALMRLGAIPIVIDPGMGLGKFRRAVAHAQPDVLIGIGVAHLIGGVFRSSFRSVRLRLWIGGGFLREVGSSDPVSAWSSGMRYPVVDEDDLAAILFTSGSTGAPKGVCYQHGMFLGQVHMLQKRFGIEAGEVDIPFLPVFSLFNPTMGLTTVLPDINPGRPASLNPAKAVAAIRRYRVTNAFGSPVIWRIIGRYCRENGIMLDSIRRILVAGAAAPVPLYRDYRDLTPGGVMSSPYGATECLPVSAISGADVLGGSEHGTASGRGICVGLPFDGVEVRIVDPRLDEVLIPGENLRFSPQGSIGEILVSGPTMTRSYYRSPDATALSKVEYEGRLWHRMGDLGYLDERGWLWFCGRMVEAVRTEAGWLYTECVEALFQNVQGLKRCALIKWNDLPALVLEPEPELRLASGDIAGFVKRVVSSVRERHGSHLPVEHFFVCRSLPVDVRHNAKIHRLSLAARYAKQKPYGVSPVPG